MPGLKCHSRSTDNIFPIGCTGEMKDNYDYCYSEKPNMLAVHSIDNAHEGHYEFKITNKPYEEFSPASEFLFEIHLSED